MKLSQDAAKHYALQLWCNFLLGKCLHRKKMSFAFDSSLFIYWGEFRVLGSINV